MSKTLEQLFNYLKLPTFYYNQVQHSKEYIYGKQKRKIYHSGELTNNDLSIINKIKSDILKQNILFPHRYQYLNNDRELLKFMMATSNKTDSEKGAIYLSGRDKQLRPIIIFNVNKIDLIKDKVSDPLNALMYCLEIAEKCMFCPGKVENWVVLVNLGNIGYVPNIPIKDLEKMIKDTTYYYPGCMDRVYLINPPLLVYCQRKIKDKVKNVQRFLGQKVSNTVLKLGQSFSNLKSKIEIRPSELRLDTVLKRLLCKIQQKNYQLN